MGPIKSAILAFLLSMGGFLAYHLLANSNGNPDIMGGLQNLGYLAMPVSAIIAGIVFVIACFAKVASKSE